MARINLNSNNTIAIRDNKEVTEMLNIKEFADAITNKINEMQDEYTAEMREIVKFNDNKLYGVSLRRSDKDSAPTFYPEQFYDDYKAGFGISSIAMQIMANVKGGDAPAGLPTVNFDFSFENIKDKLSVRVLDTEKNQEYMENVVCSVQDCGLGLIAVIDFSEEYGTVVTKSLAESSGYDLDELFSTAIKNKQSREPARLFNMGGMLFGSSKENLLDAETFEMPTESPMFFLGTDNAFGASTLFYDGVLDKIAKLFGGGFYILPSSIHELIILPDDGAHSVHALKNMVKSANATVVEPQDVLSDRVFYYDATFGKVLEAI